MCLHTVCLLHVRHLHICGLDILPSFESTATFIPDKAIHGADHELSGEFKLPYILFPGGNTVLEVTSATSHVNPVTPTVDVFSTPGGFSLASPFCELEPHPVLMLRLFKDFHTRVQALDLKCTCLPLLEIVAHALPVEHVAYAFKFTDLHAATPYSLLLHNGLLLGKLVT